MTNITSSVASRDTAKKRVTVHILQLTGPHGNHYLRGDFVSTAGWFGRRRAPTTFPWECRGKCYRRRRRSDDSTASRISRRVPCTDSRSEIPTPACMKDPRTPVKYNKLCFDKVRGPSLIYCHKLQNAVALDITDRTGVQPTGRSLSQAHTGLRPCRQAPRAAQICRFNGLHPRNPWITTPLLTPGGWKAELAWLADSQFTVYPQSSHLSTTDQAKIRESLPAKDQHSNHWAKPPTIPYRSQIIIIMVIIIMNEIT